MTTPLAHRSRGATTLIVIAFVLALSIITIAYIRNAADSSHDASVAAANADKTTREVKAAITRLDLASRRADCIRDVQGDAEQDFRRSISALFDAQQNQALIDRVREHMRNQPAWNETARRVCSTAAINRRQAAAATPPRTTSSVPDVEQWPGETSTRQTTAVNH